MPPILIHAGLRSLCSFLIFAITLAMTVPASAAAPPEILPTQDEIHQLFEQKQYPQVLQKIAKVLTFKPDVAKDYDRHDLLRLKAETHLQLKAYGAAEQAFIAASKETRDETAANVDLATAILVHRSRAGKYQPIAKVKGAIPDAISVIGPEARRIALEALFRDEAAADAPQITALRDATSLDSLANFAPTVTILRTLEMGATQGHDEQTRQLISVLAKHAQDLMDDDVQDMIKRMDTIITRAHARAEHVIVLGSPGAGPDHKPGIDVGDRKELNEILVACGKIVPAARGFGDAMGTDGSRLIAISVAAEGVAKKAVEESK